ncbi:MAG TPA: metallophosphoesterase family protein [Polyangiaceae bacterium]
MLRSEMPARTFAVGDVHGELGHLRRLLALMPQLTPADTVVFLGDYLDRGPHSKQVIELVRTLAKNGPARVVALRGNHEDAWLRVRHRGWDEFVLPPGNGCFAALRSFTGGEAPRPGEIPTSREWELLSTGEFLPADVVAWLEELPYWYEDEHAIYVHAGLPRSGERFQHPSEVEDPLILLWIRTEDFFRNYRGKRVVVGHTRTEFLPQELSSYTLDDPTDLWAGENVVALDTGAGNGGFLTALELPAARVYESRA